VSFEEIAFLQKPVLVAHCSLT